MWSDAYDYNSFIGKLNTLNFTTVVDFPASTAIASNIPQTSTQLSPNPIRDQFSVQLDQSIHKQINLRIVNLNGQLVKEVKGYQQGTAISAATWKAGIYVVLIQAGDKQWTKKLPKH